MKNILIAILLLGVNIIMPQTVKVNFSSQMTIGSNKNSKEYLFINPKYISCDSHNNIYVVDDKELEIRKYDKNGNYIKTIGRAGEGPGEFRHIKSFIIDEKDNLIIVDQILSRMTILNTNGKYIRSKTLTREYASTSNLSEYNADLFVGTRLVGLDKKGYSNRIYLFDKEFNHNTTSFGYSSIFWDKKNACEIWMDEYNAMYVTLINSENVAVTKTIYDGKLYMFQKKDNWKLNILYGTKYSREPYEIYNRKEMQELIKEKRGLVINPNMRNSKVGKSYSILVWSKCAGLYSYKNNYILVFFIVRENGRSILSIDLYDKEGKYLGRHEIQDNLIQTSLSTSVLCVDRESCFYMSAYNKDNIPVIKKYKVDIQIIP